MAESLILVYGSLLSGDWKARRREIGLFLR